MMLGNEALDQAVQQVTATQLYQTATSASIPTMFAAMSTVIQTLFSSGFDAVAALDPVVLASAHAALAMLVLLGGAAFILTFLLTPINKIARLVLVLSAVAGLTVYVAMDYETVLNFLSALKFW